MFDEVWNQIEILKKAEKELLCTLAKTVSGKFFKVKSREFSKSGTRIPESVIYINEATKDHIFYTGFGSDYIFTNRNATVQILRDYEEITKEEFYSIVRKHTKKFKLLQILKGL